jgi:predicted glycogen debranching enzyme
MKASQLIRSQFGSDIMSVPEKAISREFLLTSAQGTYSASTIYGCNMRKYHGLLVAPQPAIDDDDHVLLSSLDEKVISRGTAWRLSTHHYKDTFYPEGYRHIREFNASPTPSWIYEFDGALLKKEILLAETASQLLIRYTLLEAPAAVTLCLMPMLAFRSVHRVQKMSMYTNNHIREVQGGISISMYCHYTPLYLQLSSDGACITAPDWYYDFDYSVEQERGYYPKEDLYTPAYFSIQVSPGQSVIFSASLEESDPATYEALFGKMLKDKAMPQTFREYLRQAARQFIVQTPTGAIIKAGYYWFGSWGRDTCIALPGLTLLNGDDASFLKVTNTLLTGIKDGLLPNIAGNKYRAYNTIDASLWLIWALQQYVHYRHAAVEVWNNYGAQLKSILHHYKTGTYYGIRMDTDGLITGGQEGYALTWMDAIVDGIPVTQRMGKPVEVNALWYNAICFCLQLALENGDEDFIREWEHYPGKVRDAFIDCFWDDQKGYLADCVNGTNKDWSVRPNQLLAVSLPYSPLVETMQLAVMIKVREELLTSRGLRSLSAADPHYCGHYGGDQPSRDRAYHQGTIWPWLLAHFAEGHLKVYKGAGLPLLKEIYNGMAPALDELCLYSIAEVYEGDHPHKAGGAVAQAWSVAELLRLHDVISQYEKSSINNTNEQYTMETRLHL